MKKQKVGIYGGTFNPPHIGHIGAARAFIRDAELDKLFIIPSFIPPHKFFRGEATVKQRVHMCELAFGDIEKTEISNLEIDRGGKSYTYLTLEELSSPDSDLYMLIGTDMFLTLEEWNYPEKIFNLANICYIRRESDTKLTKEIEAAIVRYTEKYGARIYEIKAPVIQISSSELRSMYKGGQDTSEYISRAVSEYIRNEGLYE